MKLFSNIHSRRRTTFMVLLPCLKVCDDGSRSLTKRDSTVAQPDPGPPPVVVVLWIAVEPAVAALRQMDGMQPTTPGLPIRLRYSRLTL